MFLGGGTPSLMDPAWAAEIVGAARRLWTPAADLEVTLEAKPTDAEAARVRRLRAAGVNRLSLGLQSLEDEALAFLGRNHDAATAIRAAAGGGPRPSPVSRRPDLRPPRPDARRVGGRTAAGHRPRGLSTSRPTAHHRGRHRLRPGGEARPDRPAGRRRRRGALRHHPIGAGKRGASRPMRSPTTPAARPPARAHKPRLLAGAGLCGRRARRACGGSPPGASASHASRRQARRLHRPCRGRRRRVRRRPRIAQPH